MNRWLLIGLVATAACRPGRSLAIDAGVKILEVRLGEPVGSLKGSVWPTSARTNKPLAMHGVDGLSELTVRLPSGRVWATKPVHSVIYTADEKRGTIRGAHVVYERPPLSWPEARALVFALATELGVPPDRQELWRGRLSAMATGPSYLHPSFPVEGCYVLTTTIRQKGTGWVITPELAATTPQVWSNYENWPDTCR